MRVELIFFKDCPNVEGARAQLGRALTELKARPHWQEWDRDDPASPEYATSYGSPTILVDGKDVAGAPPTEGTNCCRLYSDGEGRFQGVPSVEVVVSALRKSGLQEVSRSGPKQPGGSRSWLAVLPAVGMALMPKLVCPACWPAYAGLLGSLGLPFMPNTAYLLPLTALFLVIAVGALGFGAKRHRRYLPFALGVLATIIVMVGKFVLEFTPALYGGIAILIAASFWNSWPRKTATGGPCPACAPEGSLHDMGSAQEEV